MIKFVEKIFSIPVILILEVLLLVANVAEIIASVIYDMVISMRITLRCKRDKMIKSTEEKDQNESEGKDKGKTK